MKRIFIFFQPGAYGWWLSWLISINHATHHDKVFSDQLLEDGSSHNRLRLDKGVDHPAGYDAIRRSFEHVPPPGLDLFTYQCIPSLYPHESTDVITSEIAERGGDCIHINILDRDARDIVHLNTWYKIPDSRLRFGPHHLGSIRGWNPKADSEDDLAPWELREFISYIENDVGVSSTNPKVLNIDVMDILFGDQSAIIDRIFDRFELPRREIDVSAQHAKMLSKQASVSDLASIKDVISRCLAGEEGEIPEMNLYAQAITQRRLREMGIGIRCHGLDVWPTTLGQLRSLLIA